MSHTLRVAVTVERAQRSEHFELLAGCLRIGSAAHCDVRLGPNEAAPEQLQLQASEQGLWVSNCCPAQPVRLAGVPLTRSLLHSRARLELGTLALAIELLPLQIPRVRKVSALTRVRQLAMLLAAFAAYHFSASGRAEQTPFDHSMPTPLLFAEHDAELCPERERGTAQVLAEQQLVAAQAKRERSPYSPGDGVLAVPLYDVAAACFDAAGDGRAAGEARAERQKLAQRLQESLRAHQVRLEWSLERQRYAIAASEVEQIYALLAGRNDAHARWIAAVSRALKTQPH